MRIKNKKHVKQKTEKTDRKKATSEKGRRKIVHFHLKPCKSKPGNLKYRREIWCFSGNMDELPH